ncbi:hypothetical protein PENSUB_6776 [Penicillium subrubescens]|uniref:Uncharacterized protein n=1 Tax=Penicillium subrubescens TaxID=1316194 RepID=A0A1Q5TU65_9EURO|nr:hypothetical protein PENSUB_6776 [Penicillium subrubescens]
MIVGSLISGPLIHNTARLRWIIIVGWTLALVSNGLLFVFCQTTQIAGLSIEFSYGSDGYHGSSRSSRVASSSVDQFPVYMCGDDVAAAGLVLSFVYAWSSSRRPDIRNG